MSKELLAINVNQHTEKKSNLTYLSWAWAWAEVLKIDPEADWDVVEHQGVDGVMMPCMFLPDGTAMVKTWVKVHGRTRHCRLPVMDHRNKAIKNPDAFAINTAVMRCMTKAISMHGLGLYIYAGEDLPEADKEAADAQDAAMKARGQEIDSMVAYMIECHEDGRDQDAIKLWYDKENWSTDNPTEQEERKYAWGQMGQYSKLRSAIKANRPESP